MSKPERTGQGYETFRKYSDGLPQTTDNPTFSDPHSGEILKGHSVSIGMSMASASVSSVEALSSRVTLLEYMTNDYEALTERVARLEERSSRLVDVESFVDLLQQALRDVLEAYDTVDDDENGSAIVSGGFVADVWDSETLKADDSGSKP